MQSGDSGPIEKEKSRNWGNSILSCLERDLFLELAAKIPIENIEHNILPNNFENILHFLSYQAKLAKVNTILGNNHIMP